MPHASSSLSLLHLPDVVTVCVQHPHVEQVVEDLLVAYVACHSFGRHAPSKLEMLVSTEHLLLVLLEFFLLVLYFFYLLP